MDWRTHPKLQGRFHPDHPDDLQVIVHDGGPRTTDRSPEAVWVTVTACEGDFFTGRVLNQPAQLQTVRQGQEIRFLEAVGGDHPILVTDKYLRERPEWIIHPCQKCGFSELFDAPSDLMRIAFPNLPAGGLMEKFTTFCPMCDGVQILELMVRMNEPDAFQKYPLKADVTEDWNRPAFWYEYYRQLMAEAEPRRRNTVIYRDVDSLIRMLIRAGELPRSSPQTLLDAGCGISLIPHILAFWGFRVTAIDSCPELAENVSRRVRPTEEHLAYCVPSWGPFTDMPVVSVPVEPAARALLRLRSFNAPGGSLSHIAGDWLAADLSPGGFGVVHCRNSLRHSPKPYWRSSLLRFHELLSPGGLLLLEHMNALWMRDEVKELIAECGFVPLAAGAVRNPDLKYIIDAWPTG